MRTEAEMQAIRERVRKHFSDAALAELRDDICTALENQADWVAEIMMKSDELFRMFETFKRKLYALHAELEHVCDPRRSIKAIFEDYESEEQI